LPPGETISEEAGFDSQIANAIHRAISKKQFGETMLKYINLTCAFLLSSFILSAQSTIPAVQTTGMVGLAFGETAQLNLLNPGVAPPAATGAICTATVSFIDGAGTVLKTGTIVALPGKAAALTLVSGPEVAIVSGARHQIRATITTPAAILPPTAAGTPVITTSTACHLIPTLEILDTSSGRTQVVLGHVETVPSIAAAN
jgi:hypothetical protein